MAMHNRVFRPIFSDAKEHATSLCRVRAEVWWDGSLVLFVGYVSRRTLSIHEWPEADEESRVCTASGFGVAVRCAVRLTDEFTASMFALDDAACRAIE
jgi:hypothetical protein